MFTPTPSRYTPHLPVPSNVRLLHLIQQHICCPHCPKCRAMRCSVLDVTGTTPVRKMDSSFLRSHQRPTVPELGTGAHGHPSHSMADLVQALCRQPQHSQWSCKQYLLKKKKRVFKAKYGGTYL